MTAAAGACYACTRALYHASCSQLCRRLARLEVCANGLQELALPPLPALRILILAQNELTSLLGLGNAPALEVLNLDDNRLESLEDLCSVIRRWAPAASTASSGNGSSGQLPTDENEVPVADDNGDSNSASVLPLSRLHSLSVQSNALLENEWSFCDTLRYCKRLSVCVDLRAWVRALHVRCVSSVVCTLLCRPCCVTARYRYCALGATHWLTLCLCRVSMTSQTLATTKLQRMTVKVCAWGDACCCAPVRTRTCCIAR